MAELITGHPIMPGSSGADMIYRLANLLGVPAAPHLKDHVL